MSIVAVVCQKLSTKDPSSAPFNKLSTHRVRAMSQIGR
jgi:hypothetical protein